EIIVVDSASEDGSAAMIAQEFPQVILLAQHKNVGFPAGNNIGLATATGDYLFLLNPDTEIVGNALQTLLTYLDQHPKVGMVAPQLLNSDGSHQSTRRRFPTVLTGMVESTWLQPYAPKQILAHYYVADVKDGDSAEIDWAMGAALLTRRSVYEQVGGMDAAYVMYSEELDWCRRIKAVGWQIIYLPTAKITHHSGKSSEQAITHRHINFNRAKLRYFRKYHGWLAYQFLRWLLLLSYAHQIKLEFLKALLGHKRDLRKQRITVYQQVLRSGLTAAGYERRRHIE
ncbi:MAG TPA: glycosyltransferase family 2 protein, partial [Anaerolineae bacterium]|nr:glycosyltransferase family 2 protein [Anaerolineae bacterium]